MSSLMTKTLYVLLILTSIMTISLSLHSLLFNQLTFAFIFTVFGALSGIVVCMFCERDQESEE